RHPLRLGRSAGGTRDLPVRICRLYQSCPPCRRWSRGDGKGDPTDRANDTRSGAVARLKNSCESGRREEKEEAPVGVEPTISDLQSDALATWPRRPDAGD